MIKHRINVLSIHWGFSSGGVGKYALLINEVSSIAPVTIESLCILNEKWPSDVEGLKRLNTERILIKSRFDITWISKVISLIRRRNPDLIMSHGFNGHFVSWAVLFWSKRIPRICSYHGLYHAPTHGRRIFANIINTFTEYFIRHRPRSVVAVAHFAKAHLLKRQVDRNKIRVIHNGIEDVQPSPGAREKLRREWKISYRELLIGAASRIDPVKGLEYAVVSFKKLVETFPFARLAIIGSGQSEAFLKTQVEAFGLRDKVIFTGFRSDITDCLDAFDIFILPSLAEYHSIALIEAMRAGKAIVATDVGGNTESVRNEKEGLIVPPADPIALASALERLVADLKLRERLGENARNRYLSHFTADAMIEKTANWFLRCAAAQ
jgi:glycosyltransferase involved in cell wall biosynthesis